MKHLFVLLVIFSICGQIFGQQAFTIHGQRQSPEKVLRIQVPLNQATKVGDKNILLETGNGNIVSDPGFEMPINPFTCTTMSASNVTGPTAVDSIVHFGVSQAQFSLANGATGSCTSPSYLYDFGLGGQSGELLFRTRGPTSVRTITVEVFDQANNLLGSGSYISSENTWISVKFTFPSWSIGAAVYWKITGATGTGSMHLYGDNVFIGRMVSETISQATIYGTANWAFAPSCEWTTGNATTLTEFGADTDCPTPTVTGYASAPATKVPRIKFASLPPGKYEVTMQCMMTPENATPAILIYKLTDGSTYSGLAAPVAGASQSSYSGTIVGTFIYNTAQSNIEFRPVAQSSVTTDDPYLSNNSSGKTCELSVKRFPAASEEVLRLNSNPSHTETVCQTPNWSNMGFTVFSANQICSRQEGDRFKADIFFWPTAGTGSGSSLCLNLPSGIVIDTAKIAAAVNRQMLGSFHFFNNAGAAAGDPGKTVYSTTTQVCFINGLSASFTTSLMQTTVDSFSAKIDIPVVGWKVPTTEMSSVAHSRTTGYNGVNKGASVSTFTCSASSALTKNTSGMISSIANAVDNGTNRSCAITLTTGYFNAAPGCTPALISTSPAAVSVNVSSATSVTVYGPDADWSGSLTCDNDQ